MRSIHLANDLRWIIKAFSFTPIEGELNFCFGLPKNYGEKEVAFFLIDQSFWDCFRPNFTAVRIFLE